MKDLFKNLGACEKGGEWQMALLLLSEMPLESLLPNVFSFSAAISACEKGSRWQMALLLLSEMPSARVAPDRVSLNAAISACEKLGSSAVPFCPFRLGVSLLEPEK